MDYNDDAATDDDATTNPFTSTDARSRSPRGAEQDLPASGGRLNSPVANRRCGSATLLAGLSDAHSGGGG